jgi:environmental stress-induced protein Ves
VRIILPGDWTAQPWKNGGGVTHEVARGGGADFGHRLSVAEVASDGPFSRFEGVDRHILLLEGRGFRLSARSGWTRTLDEPHRPFAFAGEEEVDCTLLGGPVRDCNVMVRRAVASAEVAVLDLNAGPAGIEAAAAAHYLLVLEGAVRLWWQGRSEVLPPLACAALTGGGEAAVEPLAGPARLLSVAIGPAR